MADVRELPEPSRLHDFFLGLVLRRLYRAEIDVSIRSVWDAGWVVTIGVGDHRAKQQNFLAEEFHQIAPWLVSTARRLYPERSL